MNSISNGATVPVQSIGDAADAQPSSASRLALMVLEASLLEANLAETLHGAAGQGLDLSSVETLRLAGQTSALSLHSQLVSAAYSGIYGPLKEAARKL